MDKFINTLFFDGHSIDVEHVLDIVNSCRLKDPFDFLRILRVQDDRLLFTTKSRSTAEAVATHVSLKCSDMETKLDINESSCDPSYTHSIYYNGRLSLQTFCRPCAFSIRVPSCLGYDGDIFESGYCMPEMSLTVRDDVESVVNMVLKMAVENAPNKEGAEMLSYDIELFDRALYCAEASLTRIYDPDLFHLYHTCSESRPTTTSSSDTELAETKNANDDCDFPF